jgi:hypothetical protein
MGAQAGAEAGRLKSRRGLHGPEVAHPRPARQPRRAEDCCRSGRLWLIVCP